LSERRPRPALRRPVPSGHLGKNGTLSALFRHTCRAARKLGSPTGGGRWVHVHARVPGCRSSRASVLTPAGSQPECGHEPPRKLAPVPRRPRLDLPRRGQRDADHAEAGAVVATSHPVFSWTAPAVRRPPASSSAPAARPGRAAPSSPATSSTAGLLQRRAPLVRRSRSSPLLLVVVRTRDAAARSSTPGRGLQGACLGRITALRLTRFTDSHNLLVTVKWRPNTKLSVMTLRIKRGTKQLFTTVCREIGRARPGAVRAEVVHRPAGVPSARS